MRVLIKAEMITYPVDGAAFAIDWPAEWGGGAAVVVRPKIEYLVVKSHWKHADHAHVTAAPAMSRS